MSKSFSVDDTLFRAQAKKLIRKLKLDEPTVVKEQAGLLAQLLTKITPPFKSFPKLRGKATYATGGSKGAGIKSVKVGFNRAILRIGKLNSWKDKGMRAAIRRGDTDFLQKRLEHMPGSNKHGLRVEKYSDNIRNKQRNARGRVARGTTPIVALQNVDVDRGLKRAVGNVGIAKASLASAAFKLGRPKPPRWISQHFSKVRSRVRVSKNPAIATFKATAKGLDVAARNLIFVEKFRMTAMVKNLEKLIKFNAKKAGFKTK
tara:strand:+ start:8357 stop:9136 length:780 start_codon:yes stop_codon:yes gene_type:complete